MTYLSYLLGKTVKTAGGERIGKITDIIIPLGEEFPHFRGVVVKSQNSLYRLNWDQIASLEVRGLTLKNSPSELPPLTTYENELLLARDILDKQILDMQGNKVVRVNDLQIAPVNGNFRVVGVSIGTSSLLTRMGLEFLTWFLEKIFRFKFSEQYIPWNYVHPTHQGGLSSLQLTISAEKLARLHPADLAEILADLQGENRLKVFSSLETEIQAEALQEMDEDLQVSILKDLSEEKAADILEEMAPDEAADLLADLPKEKMESLLSLMEAEEAEEVKDLLMYDEDSAGGLMTTEYIAIPQKLKAQQTIDLLRTLAPDAETIYYVYVVDEDEQLAGVLSLRELIVAAPETPIEQIMVQHVFKVKLEASPREVTGLMDKYDLLAVPVVDEQNRLKGIITHDDILELLRGGNFRKKRSKII